MKTIEERANIAIQQCTTPYERAISRDIPMVDGYIIGATEEHELLTRWHDPKEVLPARLQEVLLKLKDIDEDIYYRVGVLCDNDCFQYAGCRKNSEIIGWREIHE